MVDTGRLVGTAEIIESIDIERRIQSLPSQALFHKPFYT